MHLWLIQPLVNDFVADRISERQGMLYFLASTLVILIQTQYSLWWGPRSGWLFHFELVALTLIACIGTFQCWKVHEGNNFVLRAICLSVPAGIRVFVLSVVFGLLLQVNAESLFDYRTFRNPERAYDLVSYASFIGFSVYFWYLLYQGMAAISKAKSVGAAA
jgi:hypothetical protein